jgi:hypothetical protein
LVRKRFLPFVSSDNSKCKAGIHKLPVIGIDYPQVKAVCTDKFNPDKAVAVPVGTGIPIGVRYNNIFGMSEVMHTGKIACFFLCKTRYG